MGSDAARHPIVKRLLAARGIKTAKAQEAFFHPDYDADVHDPFLFLRMHDAVGRLWGAMEKGERVVVHGDYDADGICGSALMVCALREVAARAGWHAFRERLTTYLPQREGDGYGMSRAAVERFAREGVSVIVTVDCGIANTEEIDLAYARGMEVIVVDHHQLPEALSDRAILIHPLVPGETYPFALLAAVGVSYKVAMALYAHARECGVAIPTGFEKWLLDFVAIATVTDMVPLVGENRTLETFGLRVLSRTRRAGLRALMDVAGVSGELTTEDVGFRLGPRLNAPGRMGSPDVALELLLCEDMVRASLLAQELHTLNRERQRATEEATRTAMNAVDVNEALVAVVREDIRIGVAGLVAGQLASRTHKPSVVLTRVGEHFVGSGRTAGGFNFVRAMDSCRALMIRGGGHPQAAGFTIATDCVEAWIATMRLEAQRHADDAGEAVSVSCDMDVSLDDVTWELHAELASMEPFGVGNERPVFCARGVIILHDECVGASQKHVRVRVATDGRNVVQCIWFGGASRMPELTMGDRADLFYRVGATTYRGVRSLQIEIIDLLRV